MYILDVHDLYVPPWYIDYGYISFFYRDVISRDDLVYMYYFDAQILEGLYLLS